MENSENSAHLENSFINNREINEYLLETSKWGKFLAIVGYVGMGILILLAIFMTLGLSRINQVSGGAYPMGLIGIVYIVLAVIYFFPVNYLYKFSIQIKQGLQSNDKLSLTAGFQNLKSLFKFMGILTIVILSMYAMILVVAVPMILILK
jgi:hypothetical protein